MTDQRKWVSTFQEVPNGSQVVQIVDDTQLWMRGCGNIKINRVLNGKLSTGELYNVLYVPNLRQNLFSLGFILEKHISFVTLPGTCEFQTTNGKKVLEGIQVKKLYQLSFTMTILSQAHMAHQISKDSQDSEWLGHINYLVIQ